MNKEGSTLTGLKSLILFINNILYYTDYNKRSYVRYTFKNSCSYISKYLVIYYVLNR